MPDPKPESTDSNTSPVTPDAPTPAPAPTASDTSATVDPKPTDSAKDQVAKLQSQRDKAEHRISTLEQFLEPIAVERAVDAFLSENKDKFPDLTREDLMDAPDISQEGLVRTATRLQTRLQQHAQAAVHKIENPSAPVITIEERNTQLAELKKSKDPGRFQRFLGLKQLPFTK